MDQFRKKQLVIADNDNTSLSIMTLPFPSGSGIRFGIDFFAKSSQLLNQHVSAQLSQLKNHVNEMKLEADSNVALEITMSAKLGGELIGQIGENLGLEDFRIIVGIEQRKFPKMYIYEKNIK